VKSHNLTESSLSAFLHSITSELLINPLLVVTVQTIGEYREESSAGKWGMARLWRSWMKSTADFMAANGCKMPLMIQKNGEHYGSRPFGPEDAHALFTQQWLGCNAEGERLSWSKSGRDGMRAATKGERFNAMLKHECWAVDRGVTLMMPRNSEYNNLLNEQNS